ncbi:MAG: hypothetical protein LBS75_03425 [Synergistaceae bacterium]|nr:hypothetical protein [Synergistaceae bacterium]
MSFIHHTTAVCLALAACLRQRYHSRWYSNSTINSHKDIEEIRSAVNENPDMTLNELIEKLSLPIMKSRLSKLLIKLGFLYDTGRETKRGCHS